MNGAYIKELDECGLWSPEHKPAVAGEVSVADCPIEGDVYWRRFKVKSDKYMNAVDTTEGVITVHACVQNEDIKVLHDFRDLCVEVFSGTAFRPVCVIQSSDCAKETGYELSVWRKGKLYTAEHATKEVLQKVVELMEVDFARDDVVGYLLGVESFGYEDGPYKNTYEFPDTYVTDAQAAIQKFEEYCKRRNCSNPYDMRKAYIAEVYADGDIGVRRFKLNDAYKKIVASRTGSQSNSTDADWRSVLLNIPTASIKNCDCADDIIELIERYL